MKRSKQPAFPIRYLLLFLLIGLVGIVFALQKINTAESKKGRVMGIFSAIKGLRKNQSIFPFNTEDGGSNRDQSQNMRNTATQIQGTISATPNPCMTNTQYCTSTVNWSATNAQNVCVIRSPNPYPSDYWIFDSGNPSGAKQTNFQTVYWPDTLVLYANCPASYIYEVQVKTLDPGLVELARVTLTTINKTIDGKDIRLRESGVKEGYNYWLYENTKYPCGKSGNHEFIVVQKGENKDIRNLLIRFHGGGFGFYKSDGTYSANPPSLINQLYAEKERKGLFNTILENGLAKLVRENPEWRIITPSHCSHDMYTGTGQYNKYDGFARWGFSAAQAAIDFTEKEFPTYKVVTSGSSAGSAGAFRNGYNREEVVGIVMDSNANDTSTIINLCNQNIPVCCAEKSSCDCYDQGRRCLEIGAERVGGIIGQDEPRIMIEQGKVNKPIYYIWNQHDQYFGGQLGNQNTSYFYQPTHDAIVKYNPGGKSVAKMVCVTNPLSPKAKPCFIHSPTKYNNPETTAVYNWIISLTK